MDLNPTIEAAAKAVREADALVFTAGAGIGVDSGLPDFRGREGFWRAYPPIARGADLNAVTNEGWTPLHVAYKSGQPGMVDLLIAAGADTDALDKEGMRPRNHAFERPQWIAFDPADFDQYTGHYSFGGDFGVDVWREGDKFFLCEFSIDRIYPTGPDEFFCVQEPWKVVFGRDEAGEVATIDLHFLRRTVRAQKVR